MSTPTWQFLDRRMTPEHLGFIPFFLDVDDPRPAKEQFDAHYQGGWRSFKGFRYHPESRVLTYSGDPPLRPLASTHLRDELILFYDCAWVLIEQPDGSFEVSRMD